MTTTQTHLLTPLRNAALSSFVERWLGALLAWLRSVSPPGLRLVVSHACVQLNINTRRRRETESRGNLLQVEFVDIKDGPQAVTGVGVDVALEAIFC